MNVLFESCQTHGRAFQWACEPNFFVESFVVTPLLVGAFVVGLAAPHTGEHHGEPAVVIGYASALLPAVDVFFLNAHPFGTVFRHPGHSTPLGSEGFHPHIPAFVFDDAETLDIRW